MVNWGIIGFGRMGGQYLNCFLNKSSNFNLVGIASRSKKKLNKTFEKIELYNTYQDLMKSKFIDAVYISTLNNTHKNLVIEAIKYDKKVLCEKPLGLNYNEVKEIYRFIANKKNNFFEAIAYRTHPQTEALLEILKDKELGEIKKIDSSFGFKVKKIKKDSRLFNEKLGGGSILDLGCYPVSFFNLFKKKEMIITKSNFNLCETNVDIDGEIVLRIDDTINAHGKVSLKENLNNSCKVYCEKATILIKEPWLPSKKTFIEVDTKSRYYKKIVSSNKSVYEHQIEQSSLFFSKPIEKKSMLVDIEESLQIAEIIDQWKNNR